MSDVEMDPDERSLMDIDDLNNPLDWWVPVQNLGYEYTASLDGEFDALTIDNGEMRIQTKKVRHDQVKNNAGGYVFPVSDLTRIRRFLILGSTGGTYYSTEKELTMENLEALKEIINKGKAGDILREILDISVSGRNAKQDQVMLALALCARYRVHDCTVAMKSESVQVKAYANYLLQMHKAAVSIVNEVCRIPTHLFTFVKHCEWVAKETNTVGKKSTGWGRLMRAAINNWYSAKTPEKLALHLTKYKQRDGWSHRDLFRLAHPEAKRNRHSKEHLLEIQSLYKYAVKGELNIRKRKLATEEWELEQPEAKYSAIQLDNELKSSALNMIDAVRYLNDYIAEDDVAYAIRMHDLVREHIPTGHLLNSVPVWRALLGNMPMTAMVRNLGKMSAIEALDRDYTEKVIAKLTNEEEIKKSRIHPIQILMAQSVYNSGHGDKGKLTWKVNQKVTTALEEAFYMSFKNVPPTGKRFCLAYDVSGSMMDKIAGTLISCREASVALGMLTIRNEEAENVNCVGFSSTLVELPYKKTWDMSQVMQHMGNMPFGNTDCAQPMLWAAKKKRKFDAFIIFTDNETYYGKIHPFQALKKYRREMNIPDAKLIVVAMTATNFTIADPTDAGMLDVVGFDPAVPEIISNFVLGNI